MLKTGLRLLLAAALVVAVAAGVGTAEPMRLLGSIDWRYVAAGLVLVELQIVLSALRWRFTAGRLGLPVPVGRAIAEYHLSSLANVVLPGGVAGDVLRTVRTAPSPADLGLAARAAVMERISGQAAFWTIAAAGLALRLAEGLPAPAALAVSVAAVPLLAGAAAGLVILAGRIGSARIRRALAGLGPDLRLAFVRDGALSVQTALSGTIAASYVAVFALAAAAVGAPLGLTDAATLVPLVLLSMLIPVSVGGWGVREGAAALVWPLAGLPAAAGATTAAVYGLIVLAGALPGIAVALVPRLAPAKPAAA